MPGTVVVRLHLMGLVIVALLTATAAALRWAVREAQLRVAAIELVHGYVVHLHTASYGSFVRKALLAGWARVEPAAVTRVEQDFVGLALRVGRKSAVHVRVHPEEPVFALSLAHRVPPRRAPRRRSLNR